MSVTLGPRGTYANLGIPGTGLSYRQRIDGADKRTEMPPTNSDGTNRLRSDDSDVPQTSSQDALPEGAIRSGPLETMTSAGLSELKKMINEAATKRIELIATVRREERSLRWAQWRVRLARWFLIRLFSESIVLKLATQLTDAENSVNTARERLSECSIPIDFDFDQPTLDAYSALVRSFEGLITCQRAWNVTLSLPTNRFVERTRARESIDRQLVDLNFQQSDIIDTSQKAIHFTNANGNDIYFYPGFLMIPDRDENFALLNIQELHLSFSKSPYYEDAGVPSDSEIVGHAWKKENKDGSRGSALRRQFSNSDCKVRLD